MLSINLEKKILGLSHLFFLSRQILVIMSSARKDVCVLWILIAPLHVCALKSAQMTTALCVARTSGSSTTLASCTSSLVVSASWWKLKEGESAIWKVRFGCKKFKVDNWRFTQFTWLWSQSHLEQFFPGQHTLPTFETVSICYARSKTCMV